MSVNSLIIFSICFYLSYSSRVFTRCAGDFAQFGNCMRSELGADAEFRLDSPFPIDADDFRCILVGCLTRNGCHSTGSSCNPADLNVKQPEKKLPGNVTLHYRSGARTQFLLSDVENIRWKMATCGEAIIRDLIRPRLTQCLRKRLRVSDFRFLDVNAFDLERDLVRVRLGTNTIENLYILKKYLRQIATEIRSETSNGCGNTANRRKSQLCIADALNAAQKTITAPFSSIYTKVQHNVFKFCDARTKCLSRLSSNCHRVFLGISTALLECYNWSDERTQISLLTPYLNCLGKLENFPYLTSETGVVLFKTGAVRKLVNLMRDDLEMRTKRFASNLTQFRSTSTDECSPNFQFSNNQLQVDGAFEPALSRGQRNYRKTRSKRQNADILNLLAAEENAYDEGVVGPTKIVKQLIFNLNHPFLKYQQILHSYQPRFAHLTKFGHV